MDAFSGIANSIFDSTYRLDTEERETWADEALHRLCSLVDIPITLISGFLTIPLPYIPLACVIWMGPRRLFHGTVASLDQWSFTPLKYECAVLGTYAFICILTALLYFRQTVTDGLGVIMPSIGALGRNFTHSILDHASKELQGEPSWSWRPNFDLLAEGFTHAAFYRQSLQGSKV